MKAVMILFVVMGTSISFDDECCSTVRNLWIRIYEIVCNGTSRIFEVKRLSKV